MSKQKQRGKFDEKRKQEVRELRAKRACVRCRMLKKHCSREMCKHIIIKNNKGGMTKAGRVKTAHTLPARTVRYTPDGVRTNEFYGWTRIQSPMLVAMAVASRRSDTSISGQSLVHLRTLRPSQIASPLHICQTWTIPLHLAHGAPTPILLVIIGPLAHGEKEIQASNTTARFSFASDERAEMCKNTMFSALVHLLSTGYIKQLD
jgi:hypothetical protein